MANLDFCSSSITVSEFSDFADRVGRSMITNSGKFFSYSISDFIMGAVGGFRGGVLSLTKTEIAASRQFLSEEFSEASFQFGTSVDVFGDIKNARREYSEFLDKLEGMIESPQCNRGKASEEKQQETPTDSYLILQEYYPNTLAKSVNDRLEEGWTCLGGVAVGQYMGNIMFYQSMIKVEK